MSFEFVRIKYPELPGVYVMKDGEGTVIYIGKATSLRDRLSQYFNNSGIDIKKSHLVARIHSIEFIITKDPKEALILESNLIKNYQPKFNMTLKDAKHYAYLAVTDEKFPRLQVARKNSSGKFKFKVKKVFGPFVEGTKRAISARYLRRLFRVRICKKLPKKECLQYHIGNCDAPCIGKISERDYEKNIESLSMILEGKEQAKSIINELDMRMKEASNSLDYEKAVMIRDQIDSLKIFFDRQRIESKRKNDEDFLWFQKVGEKLFVQVLRSQNGVIGKVEKQVMEIREQEDPEVSFCIQYYGVDEIPDKVYSNLSENEMRLLNSTLESSSFSKPGKEKLKTLEIAEKSLEYGEVDGSVLRLKEKLGLTNNPIVIETFDISTLFGKETVASMVRFVNAKPDKSGYRKFKIKTIEGQDDFSSMKEVVNRRYKRLLKEETRMPDLVLIDGGAGQLNAAIEGMEMAGVRLPIASLAKKEEEVYLPNRMNTIKMPKSEPALKLLQQCRDEAHRFAITFHRLRRKKRDGY